MSIPGSASPLFFQAAAAAADTAAGIPKSLRFNSADSAYLSKTFSSAGNRRTFTFACWLKRTGLGGRRTLLRTNSSELHFSFAESAQGNEDAFFCYGAGGSPYLVSDAVFKDVAGWYHFCIAWDTTQSTSTDRLKLYVNGVRITSWKTSTFPNQNYEGGLNSATAHGLGANSSGGERFDGYMTDVYFIDGTAHDPTSFGSFDDNGVWQASSFSGTYGSNGFHLLDFANESTIGHDSSGNNFDWTANNFNTGGTNAHISGSASPSGKSGFQDSYPGDYALDGSDTSQAAAKYSAGDTTTVTVTFDPAITAGSTLTAKIYQYQTYHSMKVNSGSFVTASSSVVNLLSGHGVSAGDSISSITYRTVSPNSAFALGNELYYIKNGGTNIVSTPILNDVFSDSPQNDTTNTDSGAGAEVSGNYCILNAFKKSDSVSTFGDGNLNVIGNVDTDQTWGTIAVSSGKFYFETTITSYSGSQEDGLVGISDVYLTDFQEYVGKGAYSYAIAVAEYNTYMKKYNGNTAVDTDLKPPALGDVIGVAFDLDNGKIWFHKNGVYANSGDPAAGNNAAYTGLSGTFAPAITCSGSTGGTVGHDLNFGQRRFAYGAPSGFKCLNTSSLPTPTIADGSDYFEPLLYTGNGGTQTITGLGFSPDLVWIKKRSAQSSHFWNDTVRGTQKLVSSNYNGQENWAGGGSALGELTAFTSDGFTLANSGSYGFNDNSATYASWNWDAGSSTASNTDGSITSSVRASQTSGFSIVTYTGSGSTATVGHGLNAALDFLIIKRRNDTGEWRSWHSALSNTQGIDLNSNGAAFTDDSFNNTIPTSSVFTVKGGVANVNAGSSTYVAYCFTAVEGFSAFGTYEGNGSTSQGPFVYTGFAPAFLMFRRYNSSGDWIIFDNKRNTHAGNYRERVLYAHGPTAEEDAANGDTHLFLSNGFLIDNVNFGFWNASGDDYLWVAFAENPFQANGGLAR